MFTRTDDHKDLAVVIDQTLNRMVQTDPDADEFGKMTEHVTKLLRAEDDIKSKRRISNDTLAIIGANLFGIVLVMHYEKSQVIASKAFTLIQKLK